MIHFNMVANHNVDFGGIDNGRDARQKNIAERSFHPVNQRDFIVHNQISVVRRPFVRRVAVKLSQFPVFDTDPINALFHFDCLHSDIVLPLFKTIRKFIAHFRSFE